VVATADPTGKFEFLDLEPGNYQMTVRRDGFQEVTFGVARGGTLLDQGDHPRQLQGPGLGQGEYQRRDLRPRFSDAVRFGRGEDRSRAVGKEDAGFETDDQQTTGVNLNSFGDRLHNLEINFGVISV
jgi:hypothetical protein